MSERVFSRRRIPTIFGVIATSGLLAATFATSSGPAVLAATVQLASSASTSAPAQAVNPRSAVTEGGPGTPDHARELATFDFNRAQAMGRAAARMTRAEIRQFEGVSSIVLPAREVAYTIPELSAVYPGIVVDKGNGTWLVQMSIVVGGNATLRIGGDAVREIQLHSAQDGYASLITVGGAIAVEGTADVPTWITSWNPTLGAPDTQPADGRAFLLADPGRLDLTFARVHDLGFSTGRTSGVAWHGELGVSAHGDVSDSLFLHNFFGAYTFDAVGMHWYRNAFVGNDQYGMDPHDGSNQFDVAFNLFLDNGRHGLIFSRGCSGNLVRGNVAIGNVGAGIMIDDGQLANDGVARHATVVPSDNNLIAGNLVAGNRVGISLDGGSGNVVAGNLVVTNATGLRGTDLGVRTTVANNLVASSSSAAIQVARAGDGLNVSGNAIVGGRLGIALRDAPGATVTANVVQTIVGRGIAVEGSAAGVVLASNQVDGRGSAAVDVSAATGMPSAPDASNRVTGWNVSGLTRPDPLMTLLGRPVLWLWLVVLGLPLCAWFVNRFRALAGAGRRIAI